MSANQPLNPMTRKEYYDYLRNNTDDTCQFCDYGDKQIVLQETKNWVWVVNMAPYWKWHTMFVPKRHIEKFEELSGVEISELSDLKINAEQVYKSKISPLLPEPIYMFFYFWREREGGVDSHFNVKKPTHLHLHMVPEKDGMMNEILDPDAANFDYKKLLNT